MLTAGVLTLTAGKRTHTVRSPQVHRAVIAGAPCGYCRHVLKTQDRNMENRHRTATAPWKSKRKATEKLVKTEDITPDEK